MFELFPSAKLLVFFFMLPVVHAHNNTTSRYSVSVNYVGSSYATSDNTSLISSLFSTSSIHHRSSASPAGSSFISLTPLKTSALVINKTTSSLFSLTTMLTKSVRTTTTIAPFPTPKVIIECGKECVTLKHRLYTAIAFAVLFVLVTIVLAVLLYRQYQISREYQSDPSLSRLI